MASRLTTSVLLTLAACVAGLAAQQAEPRINPSDQLKVVVTGPGSELLSGTFMVDPAGGFDMPYLGRLQAAGLTPRELSDLIGRTAVEKEFFMTPPQIIVDLTQAVNKRITVTGAVRVPGEVMFANTLKLFDALVRVGMTGPAAGDQVLVVRPGTADNPDGEVLTVNLRELTGGSLAEHDIELQDGDRVIVPEADRVFIDGYVRSPGAYLVPAGTMVRQALSMAGGITPQGSERGIRILRKKEDASEPEELKDVKLTDEVQPGDTIIIRKRIL